jgi:MoxR-like ATPase
VQSALLESMQERQVTIGKETFYLPTPFLVMATQNPIESEGTFTLPEAQLDRFLFKLLVDYPNHDEELLVLERVTNEGLPKLKPVLQSDQIMTISGYVHQVFLDSPLMSYIVKLVQNTREQGLLQYGASPRGTLSLAMASKGLALLKGRGYVLPEDIHAVMKDCLRHRLILSYEALAHGKTPDNILDELEAALEKPELQGVR